MTTSLKQKKTYPIEFYVLLVPALSVSIVTFFLISIWPGVPYVESVKSSFALIVYNGKALSIGCSLVVLFLSTYFLQGIYQIFIQRRDVTQKKKELIDSLKSLGFIAVLISLLVFVTGSLVILLFSYVSIDRTINATNALISLEYSFFKTFPAYIMQYYSLSLEEFFIFIYNSLYASAGIVCGLTFIFSKRLFRGFIFTFFLFYIVAFIIWTLFPVLGPGPMLYLHDTHGYIFLKPVENILSHFHPSAFMHDYIYTLGNHLMTEGLRVLPVSTFPSAHAGWALIVAYYGIRLHKYFAIILIPSLVGIMISTFYLVQHYSLDALFGILISAFCILLIERVLTYDKERMVSHDLFSILDNINTYSKNVLQSLIFSKKK